MDKIQILSAEVIDQIAAGEVVERPSHLVKELVENSLDAGATKIQIEFALGGQKVKVSDNGRGIQNTELKLAFARHATSKIRNSEDLWSLASFGFRGEALASLSAVSNMKIISRTDSSPTAFTLASDFGKLGEIESTGGELGTTIWVEDLFGNVPARRKFLKSEAAEAAQVKNVLKALAMFHFQVEFRILYKGNLNYYWPSAPTPLHRVKQVLDLDEIYQGEAQCEGSRAQVFVSAPHYTVKTRKQIWLFAQGRWIQDNSLMAAVMDAYRGLLMHGEYPSAAVFLNVPCEDIDVNVHPTKSQVKFRQPSNAFRAVHRAVREVLEQSPWLDRMLNKNQDDKKSISPSPQAFHQDSFTSKNRMKNFEFESQEFKNTQWQQKQIETTRASPAVSLEEKPPSVLYPEVVTNVSETEKVATTQAHWSRLQVLSQAALTYIICQSNESLIIVDQHAAHERVVYESLMQSWLSGSMEIQNLLLPLTMSMEVDKVEAVLQCSAELKKMGFEVEAVGPENLAISTLPSILKESAVEKAIFFLAQELVDKGGSFALEKALSDLAATMACHSVVRAGQALSLQEMQSLLKAMDEYPLSSFCPHGRPVFVEIPFSKLEKDFGRIV